VAVSRAKRSLKQADTLLSLMRRGLVEGSPLVRADDHDLALLLAERRLPHVPRRLSHR
jgi:hypothetical protein